MYCSRAIPVRESIRQALESVVSLLVDNPSEVKVSFNVGSEATMYEVFVAQPDRAKVIGRGGATANALRKIITSMNARNNIRAVIDISE